MNRVGKDNILYSRYMALYYCKSLLMFSALTLATNVYAQINNKIREYKSTMQFSFFPGISTNGIFSGSYYNSYSFNLFGGLSAGNRILEVSTIVNVNLKSTTGIQLAGLENVVGANAFINLSQSEDRSLISEGFESNFTGIQFSGLLNYVRSNTSGIQVTVGMNVVQLNVRGFELAGMGNSTGGYAVGIQLAGLYNIATASVGGMQISSLFNYTNGQLSGLQLGLINRARIIKGGKSTPPTQARGLQIGFINGSKRMDGIQIGFINFGGDILGKQIGLINFFNKAGTKEHVRNGTPIGLLNIGSKGSVFHIFTDEVFSTTIEYTTGNCLNCSYVIGSEMPFDDRYQIFNQNALILGYDAGQQQWGFGYGFQKMLYNKFTMMPSPFNRKRLISYGLKFLHLNKNRSIDKSFNLLNRLNVDYGKRWHSVFVYVSVSLNYFLYTKENSYTARSVTLNTAAMCLP